MSDQSDTPRTDAAIFIDDYKSSPGYVPADFARQLERELADCKNDYLRTHNEKCNFYEETIALKRENHELREALNNANSQLVRQLVKGPNTKA